MPWRISGQIRPDPVELHAGSAARGWDGTLRIDARATRPDPDLTDAREHRQNRELPGARTSARRCRRPKWSPASTEMCSNGCTPARPLHLIFEGEGSCLRQRDQMVRAAADDLERRRQDILQPELLEDSPPRLVMVSRILTGTCERSAVDLQLAVDPEDDLVRGRARVA